MSKESCIRFGALPAVCLAAILSCGIAGLSRTATAQGLAPDAMAQSQANFKQANSSGNGKLTPAEFKAFIDLNAQAKIGRSAQIKGANAYDRAFAGVDSNKDGVVTWDEYLKAQSQ
jgi:hypothetical protein